MSDGATIYEVRHRGRGHRHHAWRTGVFGIAIGRVRSEIAGTLAKFPQENLDGEIVLPDGVTDELAAPVTQDRLIRRSPVSWGSDDS